MKLNSLLSKIMLGFISSIGVQVVVFSILLVIAMDFRANEAVRHDATTKAQTADAIDNAALSASEALARYLRTSAATDLSKLNGSLKDLTGLVGSDDAVSAIASRTVDIVQKSQVATSSVLDAAGALTTAVATVGILSVKMGDPDLFADASLLHEAATATVLGLNKYNMQNDANSASYVLENLGELATVSQRVGQRGGMSPRMIKTAGVLSRDTAALIEKFQGFTKMIDERKAAVAELQAAFASLASQGAENFKMANAEFEQAGARAQVAGDRLINSMLIAAPLIVVIGLTLSYLIGRSISRPIVSLSGVMGRLSGGDKSVDVPLIDRGDEIGLMARTVLRFKEAAIEKDRMEAEARALDRATSAEQERRVAIDASKAEDLRTFVHAVDTGFEALAAGNLTVRMDQAVAPEFEPIRVRFNESIAQLEVTISSVVGSVGIIRVGLNEIAVASQELAQRTEHQAASLEQTVAALSSVTSAVTESAAAAGRAQSAVTIAQKSAERSGDIVTRAITAMSAIEKSSEQIGKIIGVIDEIAFQTNLLALNAGVEAARAGEAGRGFAVVAQEVRGLAQRSAEAAKEIKSLIATSSAQVGQGVELVTASGRALDDIVTQVNEMSGVVTHIAESAREQATSLREVSTAVDQMDKVTQQNAAMVEETTAAAQGLTAETDTLGALAQKFRTRAVDGGSERRPRPSSGETRTIVQMRTVGSGGAAAKRAAAADEWNEF